MGEGLVSSAGLSVSNEAFSRQLSEVRTGHRCLWIFLRWHKWPGSVLLPQGWITAYIATVISLEGGNTGVQAILDSITPLEQGVWNGNVYMNEAWVSP